MAEYGIKIISEADIYDELKKCNHHPYRLLSLDVLKLVIKGECLSLPDFKTCDKCMFTNALIQMSVVMANAYKGNMIRALIIQNKKMNINNLIFVANRDAYFKLLLLYEIRDFKVSDYFAYQIYKMLNAKKLRIHIQMFEENMPTYGNMLVKYKKLLQFAHTISRKYSAHKLYDKNIIRLIGRLYIRRINNTIKE